MISIWQEMDVQVRPFEQLKKIMGQAQLEQQNNNVRYQIIWVDSLEQLSMHDGYNQLYYVDLYVDYVIIITG